MIVKDHNDKNAPFCLTEADEVVEWWWYSRWRLRCTFFFFHLTKIENIKKLILAPKFKSYLKSVDDNSLKSGLFLIWSTWITSLVTWLILEANKVKFCLKLKLKLCPKFDAKQTLEIRVERKRNLNFEVGWGRWGEL